jgi:hypothetical protein
VLTERGSALYVAGRWGFNSRHTVRIYSAIDGDVERAGQSKVSGLYSSVTCWLCLLRHRATEQAGLLLQLPNSLAVCNAARPQIILSGYFFPLNLVGFRARREELRGGGRGCQKQLRRVN